MQRHYKGEITIAVDSWGEDEDDAIDNYFWNLVRNKKEKAEVLDIDLDCIEEDDTDDIDYQLDCEYESFMERMNEN